MSRPSLNAVVDHLRQLTSEPVEALSDAQLLQRFVAGRDETAFAALVQRHGRLVRSACRRLLCGEEDVNDAVQATLVVLARKADSIRRHSSVASWLYGVAGRIAMNLRKTAARREAREKQAATRTVEGPVHEAALRELQALLDEEVQRLPEKFRSPFVLCCLEGKGKAEAARELGWKEGTVSGRLAEARQRLQERLARRGVTLSAALTAVAATADTAEAGVPAAAVRAALTYQAGQVAAVSARAAALAREVIHAMFITRLKLGMVFFLVLGLFVTGTVLAADRLARLNSATTAGNAAPDGPQANGDRQPADGIKDDPLPPGAVARLGTMRFRIPFHHFHAVTFAPDGKTLAALDEGGQVSLWDAAGKLLHHEERRLEGGVPQSPSDVHAFVAYAPDGKRLVAGLNRGAHCRPLCLWDAEARREVHRMESSGDGFLAAAVSRDFAMTAGSAKGGTVTLWETATGKRRQRWQAGADVLALAFAPDGKTLATGDDNATVTLWNLASGQAVARLREHRGPVGALAFSPDGTLLASAERGRHLILWDMKRWQPLQRWDAPMPVPGQVTTEERLFGLRFAPDGKTLATCDRHWTLDLWAVPGGKHVRQIRGNFNHDFTFTPDGTLLAVAGDDLIHLCHTATGRSVVPVHQRSVDALQFNSKGERLLSISAGEVHQWQPETGKRLHVLQATYFPVLSADGKVVADRSWDGKELYLWDAETGKRRHTFKPAGTTLLPRALSPDGKLLALTRGYQPETLVLMDAATSQELPLLAVAGNHYVFVGFSADGRILVAVDVGNDPGKQANRGSRCRIWSLPECELLQTIAMANPRTTALSPDGRYVAASAWNNVIRIWEVASGKEVRSWQVGPAMAEALAFSTDGQLLASGESGPDARSTPTVRVWNADNGKELKRFTGHGRGSITALAFSPDGRRLASGSMRDGTVLVWDLKD